MGEGCIGWLFIIASCVCLWLLSSICSRESYELGWAGLGCIKVEGQLGSRIFNPSRLISRYSLFSFFSSSLSLEDQSRHGYDRYEGRLS